MGVQTTISLQEVQELFPSYEFLSLSPTSSGIIDTTYILTNKLKSYILKKYERDIPRKIALDIQLLGELTHAGLNVPEFLAKSEDWYLYSKLQGKQPKWIKSYHIQALARFMAKLHKLTINTPCTSNAMIETEVVEALKYTKKYHFFYYKQLEFLKYFSHEEDFLIHGDIFKDNTIFHKHKIGVIDFIDSSCGSFSFDIAVALIGFDAREHNTYFINIFLKSYNQYAPRKISKETLVQKMKTASHFYALKRIYTYKNTLRAKELLT
ncbi:MAG: phosphotransferase [Sulfurimonas sp.]|nr:phosphotransferase [Sulfurimonas sp.]PHQ92516.1 MAG: phosphotransferase [Sulfurimonas sp.]